MRMLNAGQIISIIDATVGAIHPAGATHIDKARLENLDVYCDIFEAMAIELGYVARHHDSQLHSIKEAGKRARKSLGNVHHDLCEQLGLEAPA